MDEDIELDDGINFGMDDSERPARKTVHSTSEHHTVAKFGSSESLQIRSLHTDSPSETFVHPRYRPRQYFDGLVLCRDEGERKVTWDELFIDLLYVSAMAKLSEVFLREGIRWATFADVLLLFLPIWNAWMAFTIHMNRYATEDWFYRGFLYLKMLTIVGLEMNCAGVFVTKGASTANVFILTLIVSHATYFISDVIHAVLNPGFRKCIIIQTTAQALPLILWGASIRFSFDEQGQVQRRILWLCGHILDCFGIALGFLIPRWLEATVRFRLAFNIEHFVERVGLFTLIMLGEMLSNVIWSGEVDYFGLHYIDTLFGLFLCICTQWTYFALLDGDTGHVLHPIRQNSYFACAWTYLHLPFHIAVHLGGIALGILSRGDHITPEGMKELERKYGDLSVHFNLENAHYLGAGGFALIELCFFVFALLYQSANLKQGKLRVTLRAITVVSTLMLTLFGSNLNSSALFGCLVLILGIRTIIEEVIKRFFQTRTHSD